MKKLITSALILAATMGMVACSPTIQKETLNTETSSIPEIGLTQIVEHPSLEAIRKGILSALQDNGYKDGETINVHYVNSQGSIDQANTIANEFASKKYDAVVGITTPSAQALFNKVKETPIIYSAVTDPKAAGLEGDNISGVSDMTPIDQQLALLKELFPKANTIGMLYNTGELNSEIQVNMAKELGTEMGLNFEVSAITNSNEVSLALDTILNKVDVLYVQKDNTLASAFPILVDKANKKNIPIIGAVKDYVDQGALATVGPSEFQIGYQTGEMLVKVLKGENIKNLPSETVTASNKDFNNDVAKKFNITIGE